jgi:type II secretory pathway component PulF
MAHTLRPKSKIQEQQVTPPQTTEQTQAENVPQRVLRTPPALRTPSVTLQTTETRRQTTTRQIETHKTLGKQTVEALLGMSGPNRTWAEICSSWGRLLNAGQTMESALRIAAQGADPQTQRICMDAADSIAAGVSPSRALAAWQEHLPPILVPVLEAAELRGTPYAVLPQLAQEFRRLADSDLRQEYSLLSLAQRFRKKDKEWTPGTRMSGVMNAYVATMRWNRVFAVLWRFGVPIGQALEVAADCSGNAHYRRVLHHAAERTRQGFPLSECLAETGLLPHHLVDIVRTGELTGDLDTALQKFADHLADDATETKAKWFFLFVILPLWVGMGTLIVMAFATLLGGNYFLQIGIGFFIAVLAIGWGIFRMATQGEAKPGVSRPGRRRAMPAPKEERV